MTTLCGRFGSCVCDIELDITCTLCIEFGIIWLFKYVFPGFMAVVYDYDDTPLCNLGP